MPVPLISFKDYDSGDANATANIAAQMSSALKDVGFMSVSDLGIEEDLLEQVFAASQRFFCDRFRYQDEVCLSVCERKFWLSGLWC